MKRAIVSVINDLVTDSRVDKTCITLTELGYKVTLVGRIKKDSLPLQSRVYKMHRVRLLFEKGPLFYMEFNFRLLLYLVFHRSDLLFANDLDTLLPNYLTRFLKRIPVIYDSHELYTETPELVNRRLIRNIWRCIEKMIVPKLKGMITVSDSIAGIFRERYGIDVTVVRNIPTDRIKKNDVTRKELGLPEDKKIVIFQGSGINIQRGAEEVVESMKYTDGILLLIAGGGDVIEDLKEMRVSMQLEEKVMIIPKQTPARLRQYTGNADLGLTVDKDTNPNYRFSLPNKLFDYIHAGTPVLASRLTEIEGIIEKYQIGAFIEEHNPEHIANKMITTLNNTKKLQQWKENLKFACLELTWEKEGVRLKEAILKYG